MEYKLKHAFDQVKAEPALVERTKSVLREETARRTKRGVRYRPLVAAAAFALFMFLGGYWIYFVPTAEISIDINPSIELGINRFDRVVSVTGYNEDGRKLAQALDIRFADYGEAVEKVFANETVAALLADDGVVTVAVAGEEGEQTAKILSDMERCTAQQSNAHCYAVYGQELEQAHEAGLSYGRYRALLEWQALDPDVTAEEVRGMSMREIRQAIDALLTGEADGNGTGDGAGDGAGDGTGSGTGKQQGHHWQENGHHSGARAGG